MAGSATPDRAEPGADLAVGIGGFGAIGAAVGDALDVGIPGLRLAAVSGRDPEKARRRMAGFRRAAPVAPLEALAESCDVVVECAPSAVFDRVAGPAVEAGRILVPLSVGALLERPALIERAERTGARILVPSGAMLGLDALRAVAEGKIHSVRIVTRKPPASLAGAPYLTERGISLEDLAEPLRIFEGPVREGARHFPANANVAAALSLAGIGPDRTVLEIWADPALARNTHTVRVESDSSDFTVSIENRPSAENPRTGIITARSVVATLRGLTATLVVGT